MLACTSCGCILVSDGTKWVCPRRELEHAHAPKCPPTELVDKRVIGNYGSTK